jgi:hypothetical protein
MSGRIVRRAAAWALVGIAGFSSGCYEHFNPPASTAPKGGETKAAAVAVVDPAAVQYSEIPVGKRLVVVGSAKSAEHVAKVGKPASYVSEIGYGPGGQTVYFENKPEGIEPILKAEFARRHPAGK